MSGSSFQSVYNLANLTAPASGVTHSAKFAIVISGGGTATLNMQSQMEFLGAFIGQSMTLDNTQNNVPVVVAETTYGWQRTVPAGVAQTFQYPGVGQQNFTFTTSGSANLTVSIYDWPAFPDSASLNSSVASGTPVTVTNTVPVSQSTSPWSTSDITLAGVATYFASFAYTSIANATDVILFGGSGSKTVTLVSIDASCGVGVGSDDLPINLVRRSAANTGGTSAALTRIPANTGLAAATASAIGYSANPSALGAAIGTIAASFLPSTSATAGLPGMPNFQWRPSRLGAQSVTLLGAADYLAINLGGTGAGGATMTFNIVWTET